jgi:cardiolipin synthase
MQKTLDRPNKPAAKRHIHWPWWLLGVALLLVYLQGAFRVRVDLHLLNMPGIGEARFLPTVAGLTTSEITDGQFTHFYGTVDEIFAARMALLASAQHSIRFETYYMRPGHRADQLQAALVERAKHGVQVLFMIDSQGSMTVPASYWDAMRAGGVDVRFFSQFDWKNPRLYNDRTHRKLLLVDGSVAQIGGAGISDEWDGVEKKERTAPWADLEVRVQGPIVSMLEGAFLQHWIHENGVGDLTPTAVRALAPTGHPAMVTLGDPTHGDSNIRTLFTAAILSARHRLWIASPYFLPNSNARQTILEARHRGVEVRILTEGPENDNGLAYQASRSIYADLLKNGVDIEEYQPAMMHAKALLVDDAWICTGSANFDPRALFHNDELNVSTTDPALAKQFSTFFTHAFAKSHPVTLAEIDRRSPLEKAEGMLGYTYRWQL